MPNSSVPSSNLFPSHFLSTTNPSPTPNKEQPQSSKIESPLKIWTNDTQIKTKIDESRLSVLSHNIRSLKNKITQLRQIVAQYPVDCICLSEIWNPHVPSVHLKNYHKIIARKRRRKGGGGVGIYINQRLKYEEHNEINNLKLKSLEVVGAKVKTWNNQQMTVVSAYRPPKIPIEDTISDMETVLRTISDEPTIMCGDFNVNIATKNTLAKGYISKIMDYNMIQTVKTHTRITNYTETTIDHVISNQSSLTSIVTHMSLSDHQIILSFWGKSKRKGAKPSASVHIKQKYRHRKNAKENRPN